MDERLQGELFGLLKMALKARGMTYADLAEGLNLSEPTVKRMFSEADCKMVRLLKICDILDVSLADLLERAGRAQPPVLQLPLSVELELAADRTLFYIFLQMRDELTPAEVQDLYAISSADFFLYMRRLEKLGLAAPNGQGDLRVLSAQPIRFRRDGPLRSFMKTINAQFCADTYDAKDGEDRLFLNVSRRMRPETAALMRKELDGILTRMSTLARQDQMIYPSKELQSYKISGAFGPVSYRNMLRDDGSAPDESA